MQDEGAMEPFPCKSGVGHSTPCLMGSVHRRRLWLRAVGCSTG